MIPTSKAAGILSVGVYLPDVVRTNDWWPEEIVREWNHPANAGFLRAVKKEEMQTEGVRLCAQAIAETIDDPFRGTKERRVMPEGMLSSDMEVHAGRDAISRAGISADEIDVLLSYSQIPDYAGIPTGLVVHKQLGLPAHCMVLGTESSCNSFLSQLTLADQMVRTGMARNVLLVQSAALSRVCRKQDQHSAWFGDGATAVVVGGVPEGEGVLAISHRTDGTYYKVLVLGHPGGTWYSGDGPVVAYSESPLLARKMLLRTADMGKEVLDDALAAANLKASDVDFFASHQATSWFTRVTQKLCGMEKARQVSPFTLTANLGACNVPMVLATAQREGLLRKGDLVAMYSGGSGLNYTGALTRWSV